jgi:TolB-like protein
MSKTKIKVGFRDLGAQMVKNLSEPIRAYSIEALPRVSAMPTAVGRGTRPSVAVLPFINMSTDPEQEYFADGLTEDLITDLSRTAGLFVIARHSSFAYKGKSVDVRSIAGDLGVRYVLEGSARRAAGRVRINVQLVDAIGGGHVWAERYDRSLDDIFKVQDEAAASIVEALVGRLTVAQVPERHRPANLEAYDLCVRGKALFAQSPQAGLEARVLFERAIALDPGYAEAYRWLAFNLWSGWANWGSRWSPIEVRLDRLHGRPSRSMATTRAPAGSWVYCWWRNSDGRKQKRSSRPRSNWTRTTPMPGQCRRN